MIELATRALRPSLWTDVASDLEALAQPWPPPESRLAMPRQDLDGEGPATGPAPATSPADITLRRFAVFGGAGVLTLLLAIGPYVLYGREGFDRWEALGFGIFLLPVLRRC